MDKFEKLRAASLIAAVCFLYVGTADRAASAREFEWCAFSKSRCDTRADASEIHALRDDGNATATHDSRIAAATAPGSVRLDNDCDQATTKLGGIPQHLRALAATAKTIEGPQGIIVDFVPYPLPPYEGNPWSDWGEGLVASNGRYYSAIGDHRGADGDSYLYEYDPTTKTLRAVGDVLGAYGAHRRGDWGYGKVHGQISQGPCGQLYFHTYWGTRRGIEYGGSYTGDLLMRYDPVAQQLTSLGVPMPEMGSPSTQMWRAGGLFYGEANYPAGKGRPWPEGKMFWVYDLAKQQVVFRSPKLLDHDSGREIAVDLKGRAYYSGAGRDLLRYDPATNTQERVASFPHDGKLRASSDPALDGRIFMTTNQGGKGEYYAYLFDPQAASLRELGLLPGDTADVAISGSGEVAYFTPGAHGQGRKIGFPLMEIDRSGNIRTIVELGPIVDNAGGPYPAGTYSYSTDPANPGDIYILANAGPRGSDKAFGQPLLIVTHLPEAERR